MATLVLAAATVSCSNSTPPNQKRGPTDDASADGGKKDGGSDVACLTAAAPRKTLGTVCACDGDCDSGFCIDGVCCASACQDTCKACNVPGMMGTCAFVPEGIKPRSATTCAPSAMSTCGQDGTCDGSGACRQYPAGTVCLAGTCDGAAVSGINVCNGSGRCVPGSLKICVPYSCNQAQKDCASACTTSADCSTGHACVNGSCGPKPKGAVCAKDDDCELGNCYDGVCCESSCKGACVSCNLVGHEGSCWPIATGLADPRGVCKDGGPASCGQTGSCDGEGNCDKYSRGTICSPPICSGDRLLTAATCDGQGACSPPDVNDCPPYRCINGGCKVPCTADSDCQAGHACVNGSCGPKQPGQTCGANSECASNFCVDGVCCDQACTGACRSCNLPSSKGRCTNLPDGSADSRNMCKDTGAASCKTDGRCDGGGACRRYKTGTPCANESCSGNVYTPGSTCDNNGNCAAPMSRSCAPFACNGNKCFDACTQDGNCVPPNVCNGNSCGKKMPGASCNNNMECLSNFCAQGVCCGTACAGPCKSCALTNSQGTCTNVPTGQPDTTKTCVDQGGASCGTNGKCEGGGCQKYAAGTSCKDPTCPANTTNFTPRATCDGGGNCVTPAASSCVPFKCGTAACKATCAADADCSAGNVCTNGSCGLKPVGATCATNGECAGAHCAQGVCCNSACNTACVSCNQAGNVGMCKPLAANTSDSRCVDTGAPSCGTNGKCDGNGACQKYAAGIQCVPPSCPAGMSTKTLAKTCNGTGACANGGTTTSCGNFLCNGTNDCIANCRTTADCVVPNLCDPKNNLCGSQQPAGGNCTNGTQCQTGLSCTDGVCCSSNSCGTCAACNVAGSRGTCTNIPAGTDEPHGACPAQNPLVCGQNGKCNGMGVCSNVAAGMACGAAACTGGTFNPRGMCTGAGACTQNPVDCHGLVCDPTTGCKASCTMNSDCTGGLICNLDGTCGAKKADGQPCNAAGNGSDCQHGHCVGGICCGSASCPTCQSCSTGTCAAVATDPGCIDQGAASCGTSGCNNGVCGTYPNGTMCGGSGASCKDNVLTKAATCMNMSCMAQTQDCMAKICDAGMAACRNCTGNSECAAGICKGGSCQPCANNNDCGGKICNNNGTCQACTSNGDCGGKICGADGACHNCAPADCGARICNGDGTCHDCANTGDCGGKVCDSGMCRACTQTDCGGQICDNGSGMCRKCTQNDCGSQICDGTTGACRACTQMDCDASGMICDAGSGQCMPPPPPTD
ncbi:MAG TPA: hypothetical protein VGL59_14780 [Polyangia bacterium]